MHRKTFLLTWYFLALITSVIFFYGLLWNTLFHFISYKLKTFLRKRKQKKSVKELLELIVKKWLEDLELINKADNVLILQDAIGCVKRYEKHLQNEKRKMITSVYMITSLLHQFKESNEFFDTLVKRLKMSKSTDCFTKKYPLLKHSKKSMHYFKNFFSTE